jgi:hypothetical protein
MLKFSKISCKHERSWCWYCYADGDSEFSQRAQYCPESVPKYPCLQETVFEKRWHNRVRIVVNAIDDLLGIYRVLRGVFPDKLYHSERKMTSFKQKKDHIVAEFGEKTSRNM